MDIKDAIRAFKDGYETAITSGGIRGRTNAIRSSVLINHIHELVKNGLIAAGFPAENVCPKIGATKGELKLAGFFKKKSHDVCVKPVGISAVQETLVGGLLEGFRDRFGFDFTEQVLSVNIRSQMSSLDKNFDTLYERTFAEALNMHLRCNKMVMGELYLIPAYEYLNSSTENSELGFAAPNPRRIEKYIRSFQAINGRSDLENEHYKYEKVCLLIVDLSSEPPVIFNSTEELKSSGLISNDSTIRYEGLGWEEFIPTLKEIYSSRFQAVR